jgi:ribosome-binding factor A
MGERVEKVEEMIRRLSAEFFERESNRDALLSVTHATVSPDLKNATIYISVLPEEKENAVLDFAKRKRTDLRTFLKKHMSIRAIPFVEIEIDFGEKHRQKIDKILG